MAKFRANAAAYGGFPVRKIRDLEAWCEQLFEQNDVGGFAAFR